MLLFFIKLQYLYGCLVVNIFLYQDVVKAHTTQHMRQHNCNISSLLNKKVISKIKKLGL